MRAPFGWLGAHHFYLGRKKFGIIYACTFGLFGIGYLFDLFRMKWIVKHVNQRDENMMTSDAFLVCLVGGWFGVHHFYLGHRNLGIVYACTLGVFGIGWMVDVIRIWQLVNDYNSKSEEPTLTQAYILALSPLGIFGSHHYYMGTTDLGIIYSCSFGLLGFGWIADLIRLPRMIRELDRYTTECTLDSAYIIACSPYGIFGIYHFYLGNKKLGVLQTFTFSMFGLGWVTDLICMEFLVLCSNNEDSDIEKNTAFKLCFSPLGIIGAHHFYLKQGLFGLIYLATAGLCGCGWFLDMIRFPVLYERYCNKDQHKYIDEAYVCWFPFGLIGLHYLYLERRNWFLMYACTLGMLSFGWIVDGFRMTDLVEKYNVKVFGSKVVPRGIKCTFCKDGSKIPAQIRQNVSIIGKDNEYDYVISDGGPYEEIDV